MPAVGQTKDLIPIPVHGKGSGTLSQPGFECHGIVLLQPETPSLFTYTPAPSQTSRYFGHFNELVSHRSMGALHCTTGVKLTPAPPTSITQQWRDTVIRAVIMFAPLGQKYQESPEPRWEPKGAAGSTAQLAVTSRTCSMHTWMLKNKNTFKKK